jgi:hypothetical protein
VREIKNWVRAAAGVPGETPVMVTELACSEPDCPPFEVVMAVFPEDGPRRQRKLPCALAQIDQPKVEAAWTDADTEHDHHHGTK